MKTCIAAPADQILTPDALAWVVRIHKMFGRRRQELLKARVHRQERIDAGKPLDFLQETQGIRDAHWRVAPLPQDLTDRRVEITGPVDRKLMINALNSGANVFMADFEDALSPTWHNLIQGQINLRDAINGTITYVDPETQKHYALGEKCATLAIRPRGLHLPENHLHIAGKPASGAFVDFGLAIWHSARRLVAAERTPFFYLPKLESYHEAALWNDIFNYTEDILALKRGTIRATVLIETFPAVFEMDEILYTLKDHSAGLNCGRWDYIFSMIKTLRNRPWVMPDREEITMMVPCMRHYSLLAIKTCHRRGAHAIGGMAAQIPIKDNPESNISALAKVRADKRREAYDGHDGTWVAHPSLIPIAREEFDVVLQGRPNQIDRPWEGEEICAADLLELPTKSPSIQGLCINVLVGIQYLESWLRGKGCVPLYNLMEDTATAEISVAQVWHWLHHHTPLNNGTSITINLVRGIIDEQMKRFSGGKFPLARKLFEEAITSNKMPEFLTLRAYPYLEEVGF